MDLNSLTSHTDPLSIVKLIFVIAVTTMAIGPRMPFDGLCSVGGNLSHGFRKVLLLTATLYITRHLVIKVVSKKLLLFWMAVESIMISFLSLLTPYLLRTWMGERINFPGANKPGKGLGKWIYIVAFLCIMGAALRVLFDFSALWIVKKIGDALTFIPVYRTLRIYNGMTTVGGRSPGRGSVLAQITLLAEYYSLIAASIDILFKCLHLMGWNDEKGVFIRAMHEDNHFAMYTRILCHSIMLNVLDETYHMHTFTTDFDHRSENQDEPLTHSEVEVQTFSLVRSKQTCSS